MFRLLAWLRGPLRWVWVGLLLGSFVALLITAIYELSQGRQVRSDLALTFLRANYPYVGSPLLFLLLLTLTSWWGSRREAARAAWESLARRFFTLKPIGELEPAKGDLRLSQFHPFYLPRPAQVRDDPQPVSAEDRGASLLQQGEPVLITGKPKQGKTRLAYEVLKRFPHYYLLQPHAEVLRVGELDLSPLRGQPVLLFLDDLDHFVDRFDPEDLKRHIESAGCPCYLLSTCRTGEEMKGVREKMGPFLAKLKEVSLGELSEEEGERLAQKTERPWDPTAFDGTPGSILLGLRDMEGRYQALPPLPKGVMKALKLLYRAGIFTYTYQRLKAVVEGIWGFKDIPRYEWEDILRALHSQGFLTRWQDPVQAEDAYLEGVMGDYRHPEADFHALLDLLYQQKDAGGLFYYGTSQALAGRYEGALAVFEKALSLKPDFPEAGRLRGEALLGLERDAQAWVNKGVALLRLGRHPEALAASEEALRLKPDLPEAWGVKGAVLLGLGRHEEALSAFEQALRLKPDLPEAWNNKGAALLGLGRYQEALEASEEAISLRPASPRPGGARGLPWGGWGGIRRRRNASAGRLSFIASKGGSCPPPFTPTPPPILKTSLYPS